jgi:hypothetical protein
VRDFDELRVMAEISRKQPQSNRRHESDIKTMFEVTKIILLMGIENLWISSVMTFPLSPTHEAPARASNFNNYISMLNHLRCAHPVLMAFPFIFHPFRVLKGRLNMFAFPSHRARLAFAQTKKVFDMIYCERILLQVILFGFPSEKSELSGISSKFHVASLNY